MVKVGFNSPELSLDGEGAYDVDTLEFDIKASLALKAPMVGQSRQICSTPFITIRSVLPKVNPEEESWMD